MFISADEGQRRALEKTGFVYLTISLLCSLFGGVYEHFSHEVYSGYMIYGFLFPLAGGAFPFFAMALSRLQRFPGRLAKNLYHSGIATLTVGSLFQGALEIYGVTNRLIQVYWTVGAALSGAGILLFVGSRLLGASQKL